MVIFASIIPSPCISMGIAENTFRSVDKMMNRYGPVKLLFLSWDMLAWPGFLPGMYVIG